MPGVDNALFEGLFVRALDASGAFAAELAAAGYDRAAPVASYDGAVLVACLEVGHRHVYRALDAREAERELGRRFVGGFQQTILGRVVTTALPLLGPARFLPRLPTRFASLRRDASVEVKMTGPQSAQLTFADPWPLGAFFAGVLSAALGLAKVSPRVDVHELPGGYRLDVAW